ncbi:hypothetical protein ABZ567_21395 [Streptomyces sp. NPDC016459]|uniref:hypothetical protein n=1 Tax=Streptomyces sp. NPDC016459 TaxID=3157190 RepID=UPI0033F4F337
MKFAPADGRIDPGLDPDGTATWIIALIASVLTSAATSPGFHPADQLPTLRLILTRFLQAKPHGSYRSRR